mmetsp:Transcript_116938/g.283599  ORF Transcript_116938/g.283599 Transcript_116938/m.283599 type:complete len:331 (-) Transcript_116938:272-1264(-)
MPRYPSFDGIFLNIAWKKNLDVASPPHSPPQVPQHCMQDPWQQHQQQGGGQKGKPAAPQHERHLIGGGIISASNHMYPPAPCPILIVGALVHCGMASLCALSGLPASKAPTFTATDCAIFSSLAAPTKDSTTSPQPMVTISLWAVLCRYSFTRICFLSLSMPGVPSRKPVFGPCMKEGMKTSKSMVETSPSLTSRLPVFRIGRVASTEPLARSMRIFLSCSAALFCRCAGCVPDSTSPLLLRSTTFLLGYWTRMSPATSRPMTPPPEMTTVLASRIALPAVWISSFRCFSVCPGVGMIRGSLSPVATMRTWYGIALPLAQTSTFSSGLTS